MFRLSRIVIASLALASLFTSACQLDLDDGYRDLICEPDSCFTCADGVCATYYCAVDDQCPMGRFCTSDNLCAEVIEVDEAPTQSPTCEGPSACSEGGICTDGDRCTPTSESSGSTTPASVDTPSTTSPGPEMATDNGSTGEGSEGAELSASDEESSRALPSHPNDQCVVNDDCGFTGICLDGGCYFGCDALGACPPDQRCDAGQCLPTEDPEVICTFNGECGPDRVCIEGQCFATCAESLDCGEQMLCDSGLCIADTAPVIQCSGSGTCAEDEGCFDGKCLTLCDADRPCGQEGICQFGYCHQKVTCTLTDQCAPGEDCLDGGCQ
jgi:hypothetical protein